MSKAEMSPKKLCDSVDANLISAAPDLLKALVALLQDDGAVDDITAVRKQARAAIAKARA